jgi:uncharacterized protein (TIGR00255 family)
MILSMTGFGDASEEINNKVFSIEIKSLNGKSTDIRFKSNLNLKEKELELRKIILDKGLRGKFDVNLNIESPDAEETSNLNFSLMDAYVKALKTFAERHKISDDGMIPALVRLPNVVQLTEEEINDEEWVIIEKLTRNAVDKLNEFRASEGESLKADILVSVESINTLLTQIDEFEPGRIDALKERIKKNLNLYLSKENVDENRFEQEVIYYLEKLDINEEKVRLSQHCQFFVDEVNSDELQKGKKLSFISQEMGREINTLGAKAQQTDIQQLVVQMKDDLERIKEQVLNIL